MRLTSTDENAFIYPFFLADSNKKMLESSVLQIQLFDFCTHWKMLEIWSATSKKWSLAEIRWAVLKKYFRRFSWSVMTINEVNICFKTVYEWFRRTFDFKKIIFATISEHYFIASLLRTQEWFEMKKMGHQITQKFLPLLVKTDKQNWFGFER